MKFIRSCLIIILVLLLPGINHNAIAQTKWYKYPGKIDLLRGTDGEWDELILDFDILFENNEYHMWYAGFPNQIPKIFSMGYATSADGIHWTKHSANPVLKRGEPGAWDDHWVAGYSVTINKSLKEMWYFGYNANT